MFFKLAMKSLLNRKGSVFLTVISMSISVFVLLGVEHIRHQAKNSFSSTVSGVDLIVGARTGSLNLLLYSVFHVGAPTNNISWKSYEAITRDKNVKWAVPISLGDSHKGYRVLGTTAAFFDHFSYGARQSLVLAQGHSFNKVFDVVLGYEVAQKLGYEIGDTIVIAHGIAKNSFQKHTDNPFTVSGILSPTGTPVDQTVHVSLQGLEAVHRPGKQENTLLEHTSLTSQSITAMMLGLQSRMATFKVQRAINHYRKEPLTAILPGVALIELWQMVGVLEDVLRLIAVFVLIASLLGLSAMLLASIRERRHEIRLLRMMGASPGKLFGLIQLEASVLALVSMLLGAVLLKLTLLITEEWLAYEFGLYVGSALFTKETLLLLLGVYLSTCAISMVTAITTYRSASDR